MTVAAGVGRRVSVTMRTMSLRPALRLSQFSQIHDDADTLPLRAESPGHLDLWDALRTTLGHFLECGLRELRTTVTGALVPHQQHLLPNHFHCSAIAAAAPRSVQNAIASKG
jgi:hypothetical protein